VENNTFADHTFKPNTIPEEEEGTNKNVTIYIEHEDVLSNPLSVEATDYTSER